MGSRLESRVLSIRSARNAKDLDMDFWLSRRPQRWGKTVVKELGTQLEWEISILQQREDAQEK